MLFFEYYTKYNSSPTEYQVFTSPPTERSIYFVHHHVLPLSVFIFQEHSSVSELMLQGSLRPLRCSRTLARPRLCSGTRQTTLRPRLCSKTYVLARSTFHLACDINTEICCRTQVAVPRPATQIKDSRGRATIELDIYSG